MEELIKKIIKVDKEARNRTRNSQQKLADCKIRIEERTKEIEQQYEQSVQEIIELTTEEEKEKIAALKADIDNKYAAANKSLDSAFALNKDKWVEELVKRTVS